MLLDNYYFRIIMAELSEGKYRDAEKLEALLSDIQHQAELLNEENDLLTQQLADTSAAGTAEILLSVQDLANKMLAQAREQAGYIIERAQARADAIETAAGEKAKMQAWQNSSPSQSQSHQDYAVRCVERCFDMLRKQQTDALDMINEQWQSFLCGLELEDEPMLEREPEIADEPNFDDEYDEFTDLSEKVSSIAHELSGIINSRKQKNK